MLTTLLKLLIAFIKVGAFSFGGAYSLIPLIEKEVVANNNWLTNDEFLKVLGMTEILPGAISIKFATYTGYKAAGIPGALVANLGNMIIPASLMILAFVFYSYAEKNEYAAKAMKGIKFIVVGMILGIMFNYVIKDSITWQNMLLTAVGLALIVFFKLHPAFVVVIGAILALIIL